MPLKVHQRKGRNISLSLSQAVVGERREIRVFVRSTERERHTALLHNKPYV